MNEKIRPGVTIRQHEIVNAARKVVGLKGLKNLTVREIANELKITDGALYRHFKSKREILSLLIDDIEESLLFTIEQAAKKSEDPAQKLEAIFVSHLSYAEQRRGITFIVINETLSLNDKYLQMKMFEVVSRYLATIQEILAEGIRLGKFRKGLDVFSASLAFFGMIQSMVTVWALSGYAQPLSKNRIDEKLAVYKKGIDV